MGSIRQNVDWLKRNIFNILSGIIIIACVFGRLTIYGDPKLSIATKDSKSYIEQTNIPLLTKEAFTARRLPSYPVFLKIFQPVEGYQELSAVSRPAEPGAGAKFKELQPAFDSVVVAQMMLSIFAWVFFVIVLIRRLNTKILKPIAALLILIFAFTPQLAEWDSILMSESISFSLFTLLSAVSLELAFRIQKEKTKPGKATIFFIIIWMLLLPSWSFTRDSNANTIIITLCFFVTFLLIPIIRRNIPIYWFTGIFVYLTALLGIYMSTTLEANRWVWGWKDIWFHWIEGNTAREKFFIDHGMPFPWTEDWVKASGPRTYLLFLIEHPLFMVTEFLGRLSDAFSENLQPYFLTDITLGRKTLVAIGDLFHSLSSTAFLFPIVNGLLIITSVLKTSISRNSSWLIFTLWLLAMIYGLCIASYFGDPLGLIRHLLGAIVYLRLMIWLLPVILVEILTTNYENKLAAKSG